MAHLKIVPRSQYYYIRVYDKNSLNPSNKYRQFNTKILITQADLNRYKKWKDAGGDLKSKPKLHGNKETDELLAKVTASMVVANIETGLNVKLAHPKKLSQIVNEYITLKSRKGDKKRLKPKSAENYLNSVKRFIDATGKDININAYSKEHFNLFLAYLEDKGYAEASKHTLTKALIPIWNYAIKKEYCKTNIIEIYESSVTKKPEDIPIDEFKIILKYYEDSPEKWEWIYYLLLTMNRPSTAILQQRSKIDFKQKLIEMLNTKETRKKSAYYMFPMFKELEELIKQILNRPVIDSSDRLFSHFQYTELSYTQAFWWWYKDQKRMAKAGLISKPYQMNFRLQYKHYLKL